MRTALLLVVHDGVAVEEGAALTVLPGQAHTAAVFQQRAVRQHLGEAPVHRPLAPGHLHAGVVDAFYAAVKLEILRVVANLLSELLDALDAIVVSDGVRHVVSKNGRQCAR